VWDSPPGTGSRQTAALSAPTSNDSATLAPYFDSAAGKSFIALNGAFQLSFKAKGTGGSNTILVIPYDLRFEDSEIAPNEKATVGMRTSPAENKDASNPHKVAPAEGPLAQ